MWFRTMLTINPVYAINLRRWAWRCHNLLKGNTIVELCEIDSEGWILYELYHGSPNGYTGWSYQSSYHLLLTSGDTPIETYPLTVDEWHDHPNMPVNWSIPF